jgi:hypothetical protein
VGHVLRAGANVASALVGGGMMAIAIGLIVLVRLNGPITGPYLAGGLPVSSLSADELRNIGATALDAALAHGGSGLTFEVVQRNTLHQKPGGPPIELRAEADPTKVVGTVDEYYVNAMVSTGAVTDTAFWMQMRRGPGKDEAPDFTGSELRFSVIERDGVLWRDDGDGWYQTDVSPGMGMDPTSARRLPTLLRALQGASSVQATVLDGQSLVGVSGVTKTADYPGVVASDGKDFTDPTFDVRCWFDDAGRLVRLEASARNLNQATWDLVSETVVTFGYGSTGDPPDPTPTMAPQPLPTSEPESAEVQP